MNDLVQRLAEKHDKVAERHEQQLDRSIRDLGYDDFLNYGYWREETKTGREACENLIDELLKLIPQKTGLILDVACGLGATARYLTNFYSAENIIGINISSKQIEACQAKLPEAKFMVMDAVSLQFDAESIDNIISVEAAFHFNTRLDFLKEARRILKPSGALVLSDILISTRSGVQPPENMIANLDEYREVYRKAGFETVHVVDVTEPCVTRHTAILWNRLKRLHREGRVGDQVLQKKKKQLLSRRRRQTYVLAGAIKT